MPMKGAILPVVLVAFIFTEADSLDELYEMIRDAVRCHFDESVWLIILG